MKVMKFGGSSVASSTTIKKVIDIIKSSEKPCITIVSALGGCTDQLILIANEALKNNFSPHFDAFKERHITTIKELLPENKQTALLTEVDEIMGRLEVICKGIFLLQELSDATMARVLSFGELLSSKIIAKSLQEKDKEAIWFDLGSMIVTEGAELSATVQIDATKDNVIKGANKVISYAVAPGFIASDKEGNRTTLGRGGSDYSASIVAASLKADELVIWSDVDGILTCNPRLVEGAKTIPYLSYNEAFELSHFGAKVLYPPAIQPAFAVGIDIQLKNTFAPANQGSVIGSEQVKRDAILTGVSNLENLSLLNIAGTNMIGISGFSARIFNALHVADVNVVLIAQSCSEHGICIAVKDDDASTAKEVLNNEFNYEIKSDYMDKVDCETGLTGLALVGDGMKHRVGVSSELFKALGDNGVNIKAIAQGSSESNISIIIDANQSKRALKVLHNRFFENSHKDINIYIAGIGNVGKQLLGIIDQQRDYILDKYGVHLKINGLINSRTMVNRGMDEDGPAKELDYNLGDLEKSETIADIGAFVNYIADSKKNNSIFIDNTASAIPCDYYERIMKGGTSIVTCNKIGLSSDSNFLTIAKNNNSSAAIKYETTVGAALPVISTLESLIDAGDEIQSIQAVLSGSLSFIFNKYNGTQPFYTIVKEAMDLGFTEPDPRIDLSGLDVLRKIVILARTCGKDIIQSDVESKVFLPESCLNTIDKEDFLKKLAGEEAYFQSLYQSAVDNNSVLKFMARYENGNAAVGLYEIPMDSTLGSMKGQDNIVLIKTRRYQQPLVIQGAGAGAELTASGVFSDIMTLINQ